VNVSEPFVIVNTATVDNGEDELDLTATTIANGLEHYLPLVMRWRSSP
jgi:hypothetical protein